MYVIGHPLLAVVGIIDSIMMLYSLIVLAVCVLSFVSADPHNPIVRILHQLTHPVFIYFRRYVPKVNGIDLAPLAVFVAIIFIRTGVLPIFSQFAQGLIN